MHRFRRWLRRNDVLVRIPSVVVWQSPRGRIYTQERRLNIEQLPIANILPEQDRRVTMEPG